MDAADYDFDLPPGLIAQAPLPSRGASRLLVLDRATGRVGHDTVANLADYLGAGDVLVVNNTRVFPARLLGHRVPSGGAVECLLLRRVEPDVWDALVHPGQKLKPGTMFRCDGAAGSLIAEIVSRDTFGRRHVRLALERGVSVEEVIEGIGHMPLPPYIKRPDDSADRERYQTVYARVSGSVAAPTAGLHLTDPLLDRIAALGVQRVDITLHVGYGTFKPMRSPRIEDHVVDPEEYEISSGAAATLNDALGDGRRIIAVGTTTTRALESAAQDGGGAVVAGRRTAGIFIYPGFQFRVVGALLTNFHLPKSSLLLLVCAFARRDHVLTAYREAVSRGYRFYSYGDAMLVS